MMSGPYIQVDETPIKYLDPGNGKTGQGYLWVAHRPGEDVLFEWYTTREAKCLQKLVPIDFSGTIQCDGYSAYDHFARHRASEGKPVLLAGCWAHARRGFYEALDHAPEEAGWMLIQIGHLYEIERRLRRQRAGRALRDAYRSSQSRPICARIRRVLQRWYITRRFLPQGTMGKAIHYALDQWESLEIYLQDPLIEIDNNLVENAIRPTALGKKNWLFFGDANAGERGAVIYSIIESCRRHGVEPYSYLRDVLTRLPSMTNRQIKDVVPKAWAAAEKAAATQQSGVNVVTGTYDIYDFDQSRGKLPVLYVSLTMNRDDGEIARSFARVAAASFRTRPTSANLTNKEGLPPDGVSLS
jgi:transposase